MTHPPFYRDPSFGLNGKTGVEPAHLQHTPQSGKTVEMLDVGAHKVYGYRIKNK